MDRQNVTRKSGFLSKELRSIRHVQVSILSVESALRVEIAPRVASKRCEDAARSFRSLQPYCHVPSGKRPWNGVLRQWPYGPRQ